MKLWPIVDENEVVIAFEVSKFRIGLSEIEKLVSSELKLSVFQRFENVSSSAFLLLQTLISKSSSSRWAYIA